mmetsp:Transcript_55323/g.63536  ORF Transcript_55323/g.63536 Transcript_55323/m.63536 type:complete len:93 (-) Transcript_55323:174-452(-)
MPSFAISIGLFVLTARKRPFPCCGIKHCCRLFSGTRKTLRQSNSISSRKSAAAISTTSSHQRCAVNWQLRKEKRAGCTKEERDGELEDDDEE